MALVVTTVSVKFRHRSTLRSEGDMIDTARTLIDK
jgi:hypothetical protein